VLLDDPRHLVGRHVNGVEQVDAVVVLILVTATGRHRVNVVDVDEADRTWRKPRLLV